MNEIVVSKTHEPQNFLGQNLLKVLVGRSRRSNVHVVVSLKGEIISLFNAQVGLLVEMHCWLKKNN